MKRQHRKLWHLVPPTVRHEVARVWSDWEVTAAYLHELSVRTLHCRQDLMTAADRVEGSPIWAAPRLEADVDLARVYAVAPRCVRHTDTDATLEEVLNQVSARQHVELLPAPAPWTEGALGLAGHQILRAL